MLYLETESKTVGMLYISYKDLQFIAKHLTLFHFIVKSYRTSVSARYLFPRFTLSTFPFVPLFIIALSRQMIWHSKSYGNDILSLLSQSGSLFVMSSFQNALPALILQIKRNVLQPFLLRTRCVCIKPPVVILFKRRTQHQSKLHTEGSSTFLFGLTIRKRVKGDLSLKNTQQQP
jgi:hypothetical protein